MQVRVRVKPWLNHQDVLHPSLKAQCYAKPLHAALDAMSLTSLVKVPKRTGRQGVEQDRVL